MADLIDFSFVIIAIAIFGFVLKDSFYLYRRANLPYELRDESEKLFANVTIGLWILSFFWLLFLANIRSLKWVIDPFFDTFTKWVNEGILPQSVFEEGIKNFIIFGNFLTIGAFLFLIIITGSMIAGIMCMFLDKRHILVKINENDPPKKYRRIIKESDDFFYFESFKNFRKWTAVPKTNVIEIKNVLLDETEHGWYGIIATFCKDKFNKHPLLKTLIGDSSKRRFIGITSVILCVVILVISSILGFLNTLLINALIFILFLIAGVIALIHESLSPNESDEDD
jgi:hypothetical protein